MRILVQMLVFLSVSADLSGANAQSALPPPVDAFVASADSLAKSATEAVDLGRSTARLQVIRSQLTKIVVFAKSGGSSLQTLDEVSLLCGVRADSIGIAARRNYLQAVAAKINEVGKPSQIDNLASAVRALFASQSIDVKSIPDDAALKQAQLRMAAMCSSDFKVFDRDYYGQAVEPQPAGELEAVPGLALLGPIGSLADTIISVITPVVVEGSKIVDEEKRRRVVIAFLSDPQNTNRISASGLQLAQDVSRFVLAKRRKLAGVFNEQLAALRTKDIELDKLSECKAYLSSTNKLNRRASGAPNDAFVVCARAVWDQLSPGVSSLLKAADDYDQLADAGDSDNATKAFDPLSKSLAAIVQYQDNMDPGSAARIWNWATELLAFADKVSTAASPDNQKKIKQAIDNLVKGAS